MMMYNSETKEIAKPTELLNSIKAIMNVLQSIENYGMIITDHLLKKLSFVHLIYCSTSVQLSYMLVSHCLP